MAENPDGILRIIGFLCGGLFLLAFAGGGVFLIISYFRNKKKAASSLNWASTNGVVQDSGVHKTHQSIDDDGPPTYVAHVTYSYIVLGQEYQSKNIHIGARSAVNQSKAEQAAARYPIGSQVTVYYDPANPTDAVLERAAPANTVTLILGIILLSITLCLSCGGVFSLVVNGMSGSGS